jgi:hypothetical protein
MSSMLYLSDYNVDVALDQLRTRVSSMPQADAELIQGPKARRRVKTTADAFNKALKQNGGPFATEEDARQATAAIMEADWNAVARWLRAALRVVAILYPQSQLFITVFSVLFNLWLAKNNVVTIASPN